MRVQRIAGVLVMMAVPAVAGAQAPARGSAVTGGLSPIGLPLAPIRLPLSPIGLPREVSPPARVAPPPGGPHHPRVPVVWYFVPAYPWFGEYVTAPQAEPPAENDTRDDDRHKRRKRHRGAARDFPREVETPAGTPAEPPAAPEPVAPAPPVQSQPVYFIRGCYLGNIPPKDANLPETCDLSKTVVFQP